MDTIRLKSLVTKLLHDVLRLEAYELGVYLVSLNQITRLNETYLRHRGPTDVITFDYAENCAAPLHGEIFVCVPEAISQARRYHTTWQAELARYIIHGLLHLRGWDDSRPRLRRDMKQEEERLLRRLGRRHRKAKPAQA